MRMMNHIHSVVKFRYLFLSAGWRARGQNPLTSTHRSKDQWGKRRSSSLLFLVAVILAGFALSMIPFPSLAQTPVQVGLVVQYENGVVEKKCVTLTQPNPSGWDVLVAADVNVVGSPSGMGMAVCAIGGLGCPANDCWCKFNTGENLYWSYWHLKGGRWEYSNRGASNYMVMSGEVEGWSWGDGRTPPPRFTFEEICSAPPTATFTYTPLPSATFTPSPLPSASPTPASFTLTPTLTPTLVATTRRTSSLTPTLVATTRQTPSLTPSPTITLPFGMLVAATTVVPAQTAQLPVAANQTELSFDLQSISMTATAAEASRQQAPTESENQTSASASLTNLGLGGLDFAYAFFFAIVGGLLGLLVVLMRRRGA